MLDGCRTSQSKAMFENSCWFIYSYLTWYFLGNLKPRLPEYEVCDNDAFWKWYFTVHLVILRYCLINKMAKRNIYHALEDIVKYEFIKSTKIYIINLLRRLVSVMISHSKPQSDGNIFCCIWIIIEEKCFLWSTNTFDVLGFVDGLWIILWIISSGMSAIWEVPHLITLNGCFCVINNKNNMSYAILGPVHVPIGQAAAKHNAYACRS